jgi:hypothetical protein
MAATPSLPIRKRGNMARKPQRNMPKVPRSNVRSSTTPSVVRERPVAATGGARTYAPGPESSDLEQEYVHVKRDLARIGLFASLIFAAMFVLRFVVGV